MSRCIILLDGKGLDRAMGQEIRQAGVLVTVDRGLDTAFELETPPRVAFVGPTKPKQTAHDWANFSRTQFENYGTGEGQSGAELALEWALTTASIRSIDIANAFTGDPLIDHARLLLLERHRSTGAPVQIIDSKYRWLALDSEFTLNGRAGDLFSLVPVSEEPVSLTLKNGDQEVRFDELSRGTTVLVDRKLQRDVANIRVLSGLVLARLPRSH